MLVKRRSLFDFLPPRLARPKARRTRQGARLRLLRNIVVLMGGCMLLIVVLAGIHNLGWIWRNRVLPEVDNFRHWISDSSTTPRSLDIDIKFKELQWLAYNRQEALNIGRIVQHEASYVPAKIHLPDRTVKVKMRLKGDVTDHVEGDKWSYRIKVDGNDAIFGMSFFSIQDPVRSCFVYEWVLNQIMRYEGLIAPRYDFIHVTINGKPMGIYALEESFSKEMLEAHNRREAPIVRLNESKIFINDPPHHQREIFFAAQIDAFQSEKTNTSPILRKQFAIARNLLEGFRDQCLPFDQVFDGDRTATYFALLDLCSASHAARWKNIRFYYDPMTSLLEPIPYNAYTSSSASEAGQGPTRRLSSQYVYGPYHVAEWMDAFFRDPTFYKAYVRALERISALGFVNGFFAEIDDRLQEKLRIIHKDDPAFNYSKDYIVGNARTIRNAVRPTLPIRVHLDADKRSEGTAALQVANTVWLAIELAAVVDRRTNTRYPFQQGLVITPQMHGRAAACHSETT